jgi:hypothetical protein
MKIRLGRRTIVELFATISEAERSVHRVLDPAASWASFQQYYSLQKRERICGVVDSLRKQNPPGLEHLAHRMKEATNRQPSLLRVLLGRWSAPWKSSWPFSPMEVQFMVATWQSFLCCLESAPKPGSDYLIGLRRDFCACRYLIEFRCVGMKEIKRNRPVAHFHQTEWLNTVQVEGFPKDAA